jgi:hypothetical protein
MKPTATTFEVQQEGQKARLFRFTEPGISIGFTTRCDLPLEPHSDRGAELEVLTRQVPYIVRVKRVPGAFSLNGAPCAADAPLSRGDVLSIGPYRITVRDLPDPEAAAPAAAPASDAKPAGGARPEGKPPAAAGTGDDAPGKAAAPQPRLKEAGCPTCTSSLPPCRSSSWMTTWPRS